MARRERDYAAEYARRVAGTPKGSPERAEARGHAEESPRAAPRSTWTRLEAAAESAIASSLVRTPKGWVYSAVDAAGKVTTIRFGKVPPERIFDRLRDADLPVPDRVIGT